MRILRVIASMNPEHGGPCQGIRNSIPAQETMGIISEVVCFDPPNANFLEFESLTVHALGPARGPYAFSPKFKKWLGKNIMRFDVIIIHGLWLYNSYGTYRVWKSFKDRLKKVPRLYVMPHGMLDPYFQKAKSRKLKAVRNWIFWKVLENKVINGVDGVLFTCEEELLLARESFSPYHPKNEINIGYGIEIPPVLKPEFIAEFLKFCPEVTGRSYWLFLSRIHPKKGLEILITAYLSLKKENRNIPDLVIAGPGRDTAYGQLLNQMAEGETIYFPGMLEGFSKWGAFYGCEAFLLPSHQENFGIAIVEAMACGKPVLISNKVNIWREIEQAGTGLICEDDAAGVYAMLSYWLKESPQVQKEMGINAFNLFKHKYAIEKAAYKMVESLQ